MTRTATLPLPAKRRKGFGPADRVRTASTVDTLAMGDDEARRAAAAMHPDQLHDPVLLARLPLGGPGELRVWELGDGKATDKPLAIVWSLYVPAERVEAVRHLVSAFVALVRGEPDDRPAVVVCEGLERRKNTLVRFVREAAAAVFDTQEPMNGRRS